MIPDDDEDPQRDGCHVQRPLHNSACGADHIAWDNSLLETTAPSFVPIISPRYGATVHGVFVSDKASGVWTHWHDQRTVPCLSAPAICESCASGQLPRRKAYALAVLRHMPKIVLVEFTAEVIRKNPCLLDMTPSLRSRSFRLFRSGQGRTSRCVLVIDALIPSSPEQAAALPPAVPISPLLLRIWGIAPPAPSRGCERAPWQD